MVQCYEQDRSIGKMIIATEEQLRILRAIDWFFVYYAILSMMYMYFIGMKIIRARLILFAISLGWLAFKLANMIVVI